MGFASVTVPFVCILRTGKGSNRSQERRKEETGMEDSSKLRNQYENKSETLQGQNFNCEITGNFNLRRLMFKLMLHIFAFFYILFFFYFFILPFFFSFSLLFVESEEKNRRQAFLLQQFTTLFNLDSLGYVVFII